MQVAFPLFKLIASTIHPDPEWQKYSSGVIGTLYRKKQEEAAKQSQIIAEFQQHVAGRLSTNPKLFLTIMPWITAPPNFRILGAALLILGIGLVSIAIIWKSKTKSRTTD